VLVLVLVLVLVVVVVVLSLGTVDTGAAARDNGGVGATGCVITCPPAHPANTHNAASAGRLIPSNYHGDSQNSSGTAS
jgi:hypothetical protein